MARVWLVFEEEKPDVFILRAVCGSAATAEAISSETDQVSDVESWDITP